jgi:hypothetical protein
MPARLLPRRRDQVHGLDRPQLERALAREEAAHLVGHLCENLGSHFAHVREPLGAGHLGHSRGVIESPLGRLERRGHVEDRPTMLNSDDTPRAEALAVARDVDLINDGRVHVAGQQEIRVQGVDVARTRGVARGRERLTEHLTAEHSVAAEVAALATEDVVFDALELEQLQQVSEDRLHRSAPSVFW